MNRFNIKKHHEPLRMMNGVKGHYLHTVDGKRVMMEKIISICLMPERGGFAVIAILRDGKKVELFGSSNFMHCEQELNRYRCEFEQFKRKI